MKRQLEINAQRSIREHMKVSDKAAASQKGIFDARNYFMPISFGETVDAKKVHNI